MSNSDWWSKKIGHSATPRQAAPTGPSKPVPYIPPSQQPNIQVNYDPNSDQLVTKAQSAKKYDHCPNCSSGNYFAPAGTQRMRCYECGYPVMQGGSGAGMPSGSGTPATPAKQVGQNGGFNPNIIVDRTG